MVDAFHLKAHWPANGTARDPFGKTFCQLKIQVGGENVSLYSTSAGQELDHLEIPSYPLAEWIVENWWPLLWEPRKSEEAWDDPAYRSRHSFIAAQSGFALPDVWLTPSGNDILVTVKARSSMHADAKFAKAAQSSVKQSQVEGEFLKFVEGTVRCLVPADRTLLQEIWSHISERDSETFEYCKLIGALGLSPYDDHPIIDRALDAASSHLSQDEIFDLCLTAKPENFVKSAYAAVAAHRLLSESRNIDLTRFNVIPRPPDQQSLPAWRIGYQAAQGFREALGGDERDLASSDRIFDLLGIDSDLRIPPALSVGDLPISGAASRNGEIGRLALLPASLTARRFAAARGAYFLWTAKMQEARLMTSAVTRDQQVSRAFAADVLVPRQFVRSRATKDMRLDWDDLEAIANEAKVASDVVKFQATNQGIQIVN